MFWRSLLALLALFGCHSASEEGTCLPPNRWLGERCVEPGALNDGCPAGTLAIDNGSCQPAGVPPELCAEGFTHDGVGCEPILPAGACAPGQMALPGESVCRPVMPCGSGKWGDIPVDASSVYVDGSYAGADSDGTAQKPWVRISDAIAAAPPRTLIAVAAGQYLEDLVIDKSVRVRGVCPDQVEIAGLTSAFVVAFGPGASGGELSGLAVTGFSAGVELDAAQGVLLDELWIHDTLARAVSVLNEATLSIRRSLLEHNREFGLRVSGAQADADQLVVRGSWPRAGDQELGRGIQIRSDPDTSIPSKATVRRCLVEDNHDAGVLVSGSEATLDGLVVRRTLPNGGNQEFGRGIDVSADENTDAPATIIVRSSLIDANHDAGVSVIASNATLEGIVARGTLPRALDQEFGRGIVIQPINDSDLASTALIRSSLVSDNHEVGVLVIGSDATLEGILVRRTLSQASDRGFGTGLAVQVNAWSGRPATAVVRGSSVEDNRDTGILVNGADAAIDGVVVRRTLPRERDASFGDGIAVASLLTPNTPAAHALVTHSRIEENARAGVSSFGAIVELGDSVLSCNAFDLNGESLASLAFIFHDLGDNICGCSPPANGCAAKSSGLTPPEPPDG